MNASEAPLQHDPTAAVEDAAGCDEPDCLGAVAELFNYLDGELDDDRRSAIQGHLDSCGPCLEAFDFHAELRTLIGQKCRSQLPDGLKDRVLDALRALEG